MKTVSKVLMALSFVFALSTGVEASKSCKAFAGTGDGYGIVAVTSSYDSAMMACEDMNYTNCKVSCSTVEVRRCKGWARGGRGMDLIVVANTEEAVAAACDAQGKRCQISCGTTSSSSQGRDWGRDGK